MLFIYVILKTSQQHIRKLILYQVDYGSCERPHKLFAVLATTIRLNSFLAKGKSKATNTFEKTRVIINEVPSIACRNY